MPEATSETTPLPLDDSPEGNARPSGWSKTWIVLGLLVLAHAVVGAYLDFLVSDLGEKILGFLLMGVLVSQPILFSIWASFAHQRFYRRFLCSLLLCTLVSFAEELGILFHGNHDGLGVLMMYDMTLFLAATSVLSVFRHFSRWQIMQPNSEDAPSAYGAYHFGIKHLLILTTITAFGCGLFRTLYLINPDDVEFAPSIFHFVGGVCAFLALLFPVVAIPWYTLAYQRRLLSLLPVTLIIWGLLDLAAYFLMMKVGIPFPGVSPYELIVMILQIQLGSGLSSFATTLVIRFCGFRMIREASIQKQG